MLLTDCEQLGLCVIELVAQGFKLSLLLFVGPNQWFRVPIHHSWKVDWCHRLGRLWTWISLDEARWSSPFSWHLFLALGARELRSLRVVNWVFWRQILSFWEYVHLGRLSRWDEGPRWIYWLSLLSIDWCTLVWSVLASKHVRGSIRRVLRLVRLGSEWLRGLTRLLTARGLIHLLSTLGIRSTKHLYRIILFLWWWFSLQSVLLQML